MFLGLMARSIGILATSVPVADSATRRQCRYRQSEPFCVRFQPKRQLHANLSQWRAGSLENRRGCRVHANEFRFGHRQHVRRQVSRIADLEHCASGAEIASRYDKSLSDTFVASAANLVSYWKFDEGVGGTATNAAKPAYTGQLGGGNASAMPVYSNESPLPAVQLPRAPFHTTDLAAITSLQTSGDVADLSGLEHLVNLTSLNVAAANVPMVAVPATDTFIAEFSPATCAAATVSSTCWVSTASAPYC